MRRMRQRDRQALSIMALFESCQAESHTFPSTVIVASIVSYHAKLDIALRNERRIANLEPERSTLLEQRHRQLIVSVLVGELTQSSEASREARNDGRIGELVRRGECAAFREELVKIPPCCVVVTTLTSNESKSLQRITNSLDIVQLPRKIEALLLQRGGCNKIALERCEPTSRIQSPRLHGSPRATVRA